MASFLSTLFGGGAEKEAADKNRQLYTQYQNQGQSYLTNGLGQSTGALRDNQAAGLAALQNNQTAGTNILLNGQTGALSALDQAGSYYAPLAAKYGAATTLGLDALGANGAAAGQAAWNTFQNANPQTQGVINQGLDAINRRRAAGGMFNSGNADLDALNFAQNTQNQQYNAWVQSLNGYTSPELAAASGQASAAANKAGVYTGTAGQLANLGTTTANGVVGLGNATASGLAGLYQQNASDNVGLLGNTTSGQVSANNLQAAGEAAGAKNLLGAGLGLATLAAGGGGLGGLGSSLGNLTSSLKIGNMFMGGGSPTGY